MSKANISYRSESLKVTHSDSVQSQISVPDNSTSKSSKVTLTFMEKRLMYRIMDQGVDCSPDNIMDANYVTMEDEYSHAAFETKLKRKSEATLKESNMQVRSELDTGMKVYATTISLDDIHIDHTYNTSEGLSTGDVDLEQAPSAFYLSKEYPIMSYPPEIFVVLKETETQFLFELPSYSFEKGTTEASITEEENEYYQYITVGKGRNRKMVLQETQTNEYISQSRHTLASRPQKKNAMVFASLWDMHDTYANLALIKKEQEQDEMVMYQSVEPTLLRKKEKSTNKLAKEDGKAFNEIATTVEFHDALLLTERVLSTLNHSDAQKKFRGLVRMNPLSLDLVYIYTMKPLWTFECETTNNHPITSIAFNPKNEDILAVGHGKFAHAENYNGIVAIWCTKNPNKPERMFRFDDPITSVAFSDRHPNQLACGFSNGDVIILDITSHSVKVIAKSQRNTNPCFEPIWEISWHFTETLTEYVMTACQDGRINRLITTKTHDFICTPMMRICRAEGKLKGLDTAKSCSKIDVPITRHPAALCVKWLTNPKHVYIVGTDEGCIHKCSMHYLNQHMDVYRVHTGPVYGIEISPFMNNLIITCGADNAVRLWLVGINDVIMTLNCPAAVYGVTFCPINSTVILTISGNVLSIWDLRRKNHMPCAEYNFPSNVTLTFIKFSRSGDNVFVGDTSGKVHTFHLEDTPIPPFYQRKLLDEALKKALCTRPHILRQLLKLENFKDNN
ncbi:hypothetical protein ACJJTC_008564 [Scirpophaga incertulas]